jgi:thiamine-monophosphate kinase
MDEFDLIARYFKPLEIASPELVLGIGDDAAVIDVPPAARLVVAVDTLIEGVHFPVGLRADAIGHRLAAVNLSDLAAMGALPRYATLALTMPQLNEPWLAAFAAGLGHTLKSAGVSLIGGDTTRGPLTLTLQLLGFINGEPLTRGGARCGDLIAVSGTLGDARAGLDLAMAAPHATDDNPLLARFLWPTPRLALGAALRSIASAGIDVSDGLLADIGHIMAQSGCRALLDIERLPLSAALLAGVGVTTARAYALSGGDDYELALCIPAARLAAAQQAAQSVELALTVIGEVVSGAGVQCRDSHGHDVTPPTGGYRHFD